MYINTCLYVRFCIYEFKDVNKYIEMYVYISIESQLKMIQDVKVQNQKRRIEADESDLQSKVFMCIYIYMYVCIYVYTYMYVYIYV
jgi:hypothetical protein